MMKKHGQGKPVIPANHLSDMKPKASHNNTKSPMTGALPHGKDHAKIMSANSGAKLC